MNAHWFWPQYTVIALYAVGLISAAAADGEAKKGKVSFPITLVATGLGVWVLWMGGFFA